MHVWVLETFDRTDEYCEYNSEVVAVYGKESFNKARQHYKRLCDSRIEKGNVIDRWKNKDGYHFTSQPDECEYYKCSYVGLIKKEVM